MTLPVLHDKVWVDKSKYDEAECKYYEKLAKVSANPPLKLSLAGEVAKARQHIKDSLSCMDGVIEAISHETNKELSARIDVLNKTTGDIWKVVNTLCGNVATLEARVKQLEGGQAGTTPRAASKSAAPVVDETENDDGVDLFGSDSEEETEEAKKVKEERLAAYAAKKSKKPVLIAKSNIILDVKPWDDETDMKVMEKAVREVSCDGLLWGASKLVPLAYGIHKLQISCVVEDDKVSIDWLQETLEAIEDYVQSVDIAAFNKV